MSPFGNSLATKGTTTKTRQPNGMHHWILNSFLLIYSATVAVGNPTTGFDPLDLNGSEGSTENETITTPGSSSTSSTVNSKIIIDSSDDIIPIQSEYDSVRSSVIFFSASLSMFAAIGVIIFFRKCVNCPSGQQDGQNRHGRHHYYTAGGEIAHFRTLVGRGPNVVTTVELDDTLDVDVTGIDVPLTPSPNTKLANSEEDEEINLPTTHRTSCHLPLISIGDSTSGFRFYDDDDDEQEGGGEGEEEEENEDDQPKAEDYT